MKYTIGTPVKITDSTHSAIVVGDTGKIDSYIEKGYGVAITKFYPSAMINEKGKDETRVIYFRPDQIRKIK